MGAKRKLKRRHRPAQAPRARVSGPPEDLGPPLPICAVTAAVIISVPFFARVWIEHGPRSILETNVPVADLMIWLCVVATLIHMRVERRRQQSDKPPSRRRPDRALASISIELWVFVAAGGLSLMLSSRYLSGMPEFIQCVNYYILWFWVTAWASRYVRMQHFLVASVVVILFGGLLLAAWQIWCKTPTYLVRSMFRDHPTYVAAFVMLAPLAWCRLIVSPKAWPRALGYVIVGLGCACLGSAAAIVLVWAQTCLAARLIGDRWIRRASTVVGISLAGLLAVPSTYRDGLLAQPADWVRAPMAQRRAEVLLVKRAIAPPIPSTHFGLGSWHCFLASNLPNGLRRFEPPTPLREKAQRVVVEYFAESWSALGLIARGPLLGSGLGSWQDRIGTGYGILERTGTSFPNTSNGYLMIGVTSGLVGLAAWLLALRRTLVRAYRRIRRGDLSPDRTLIAGCVAGLIGAAVVMLVCPFTTQPAAVYWVLLAALIHGMTLRRART